MKKSDLWDGSKYRDHSSPQERSALAKLSRISFGGAERVLDIGCGDGRVTAHIASLLPDGAVIGIDASESMIGQCTRSFMDTPRLAFSVGDATSFSFDHGFDYVLSFNAFHWVEDKRRAFGNIYDALKPGGRMILLTGSGRNPHMAGVASKSEWIARMGGKTTGFYPISEEEIREMLTEIGFAVEDVEVETVSDLFENEDTLFHWLMALVPHSTGLGPEDSAAYSKEIVDSFLAEKNDRPGPIELKAFNLYCRAAKPAV